jgi:RNA polymerase sigma factor (sigma-70 family)
MHDDDRNFWELPFDPGDLDDLAGALSQTEDAAPDSEASRARRQVLLGLRELVASSLTDKQRALVELYFYEGLTQQEVAARLGISQQVVSRQLFGVVRKGRKIGGAIQRLRRLCIERGWDPDQWV